MKLKALLLAVTVLVVISETSNAAVYTYDFTAFVTNGTYLGETGMGTFTYDTDNLETDSPTIRAGSGGLTVTLDLFDQTFTQENDVDFGHSPSAPSVVFDDITAPDKPSQLDFWVSETCSPGMECDSDRVITPIDRDGVMGFGGWSLIYNDVENRYYWEVHVIEPVPVPATVYLLGSGLIGLMGFVKRRKA